MRISEISSRLAAQAESIAAYLLPSGKVEGGQWRVGSVGGDKGRSLSITLTGDRAGKWVDHADDSQHGDLIDLWSAVRGTSLPDTLKEIKSYLGIKDHSQKFKPQPFTPPTFKQTGINPVFGAALEYLRDERKIPHETLKQFSICSTTDAIVFPYLKNGERQMVKFIGLDRSNGKKVWTSKGGRKTLFGWQALPENARKVVITEGEIDALTLASAGLPALSIPYGAGNQSQSDWIENDFDDLERFEEIYVWMDADEAGEKTAETIAERLGIERCRIVKTPGHNDINEMLQAGVTDFQRCLDESEWVAPARLRNTPDFIEDVWEVFNPSTGQEPGFDMNWPGFEHIRFRPAELIVISGFNGHGKSQLAGQIMLEAMANGMKTCIASLEMPAPRVLARLVRQAAGLEQPARDYFDAVFDWIAPRTWIFDHIGRVSLDDVLEAFTYAHMRFGVSVFLIDSLMMLGIATDDYQGQKDFVQRVMEWKMQHNVTVFLVAHSRKQASEDQRPSKLDVRGAGEITDMADTVLTVWRDKRENKEPGAGDTRVDCSKQRNGEGEGSKWLWFHAPSFQFRANDKKTPYHYVQFSRMT
jgi:twinkle protein